VTGSDNADCAKPHRFRIEVPTKRLRETGAQCQMDAVGPVPETMSVEAWGVFETDIIVYEGEHCGTPEDFAVVERLMRVARDG
jgi:hypothetical protein